MRVLVRAPLTGKMVLAYPADWGPHEDTDRVCDVSPSVLEDLGIDTDDEVEVIYFSDEDPEQLEVCISSGHGKYIRGASGIIDEVDEARRVVPKVAEYLEQIGVDVITFNDDTSHDQTTNLHTIVDFHNEQRRDLDVSVHFNANVETENPMGTECLFLTQELLADDMAEAIAKYGHLKDRGPKERTDLYFLNHTDEPAILIEVCFVDSSADCSMYKKHFDAICMAIAGVIASSQSDALVA
jgi:N-acetylmuramoyl-L-alanine amidase